VDSDKVLIAIASYGALDNDALPPVVFNFEEHL
jgi:hypothetical protein